MAPINIGFLAALVLIGMRPALAAECSEFFVDLRNQSARVRFAVEVADDSAERSRGLMFRESMPQFSGMLFIYETAHDAAFWMKNTLIPLDMLFMDGSGTVTRIVDNAVPLTETPRLGGPGIKFVLEVNAGLARTLGLAVGTQMRHIAVDRSIAAWPCSD